MSETFLISCDGVLKIIFQKWNCDNIVQQYARILNNSSHIFSIAFFEHVSVIESGRRKSGPVLESNPIWGFHGFSTMNQHRATSKDIQLITAPPFNWISTSTNWLVFCEFYFTVIPRNVRVYYNTHVGTEVNLKINGAMNQWEA